MSYCDYNPTLFKEFTSMKTKVKPALSSTWKLSAFSYRKNESCVLSNAEGIKIADISISRLLDLMKQEGITMIGDALQGTYIIGNDRSLYTEEMYNIWKDKFEQRISTEIPKKELIENHLYKTVCGSTMLYLGKRYIINVSRELNLTKGSWEYLCVPYFNVETPAKRFTNISKVNQKAIEDLGLYTGESIIDWENTYHMEGAGQGLPYTVYFGTEVLDIKDAEFKFFPVEDADWTYDWRLPFVQTPNGETRRVAKERQWGSYRSSDEKWYISNETLRFDIDTRKVFGYSQPTQRDSIKVNGTSFRNMYKRGYFTLTKKDNT
jgi:hypothetical protein